MLFRVVDKQRESAVLVIAASIAAIRLRGEEIKANSPRLRAVTYDSVTRVREVMREVERPEVIASHRFQRHFAVCRRRQRLVVTTALRAAHQLGQTFHHLFEWIH
jgi:hypothetical protein